MWNSVPLTICVEYFLFAAGTAVFLTETRTKDRVGNLALWTLLGTLGLLYGASLFGPAPPNMHVLAYSVLAIWLTVPWAAWADRHRQSRSEQRAMPSYRCGIRLVLAARPALPTNPFPQ